MKRFFARLFWTFVAAAKMVALPVDKKESTQ